ncbi:MAG: hypothetical protein QXV09_06300 [Candidatus Bathyarchaeia archaeon]
MKVLVAVMLRNSFGKLLVYAPTDAASKKRLKFVQAAAEETAKLLKLELEVVKFRKSLSPIYVYYENGDEEPIPLYCDKGKINDLQEICATLRKMMFVLSFHPRHSALKHVRGAIMRLS